MISGKYKILNDSKYFSRKQYDLEQKINGIIRAAHTGNLLLLLTLLSVILAIFSRSFYTAVTEFAIHRLGNCDFSE